MDPFAVHEELIQSLPAASPGRSWWIITHGWSFIPGWPSSLAISVISYRVSLGCHCWVGESVEGRGEGETCQNTTEIEKTSKSLEYMSNEFQILVRLSGDVVVFKRVYQGGGYSGSRLHSLMWISW